MTNIQRHKLSRCGCGSPQDVDRVIVFVSYSRAEAASYWHGTFKACPTFCMVRCVALMCCHTRFTFFSSTTWRRKSMRKLNFSLNSSLAQLYVAVALSFRDISTSLAFATIEPLGAFKPPLTTLGAMDTKKVTTMRLSKNDKTDEQESLSSPPPPLSASEGGKDYSTQVGTWNPLRLLVLRLGFTEPAWTSPLNYGKKDGTFRCAYCGLKLFDSNAKYDSGSGWPSFWRSIEEGCISYKKEFDGRLECRCGRCKSHLGHVFLDGPLPGQISGELLEGSPESDPRSGRVNGCLPRFCINGASMRFDKRDDSD
jgi:peptide-methionine (R)-S-oxide reductase